MGSTTERRKHKRYEYEAFITHNILSQEVSPEGKICNFSKDGLYFVSNQTFLPMEDIFIEIINSPGTSSTEMELVFDVEIIWCRELPGVQFRYGYGARFKLGPDAVENRSIVEKLQNLSLPQPMQSLPQPTQSLPQPTQETHADPRGFPRKICQKSIIFKHGNQVCRGLVANMSRGGAFIKTRLKLGLGQKIQLPVIESKSRKHFKVPGWIVRVASDGFGVSLNRRSGSERRSDLDRRIGKDRRKTTARTNRIIKVR